jgi:Spy/CpxP family protein refolding chaperone
MKTILTLTLGALLACPLLATAQTSTSTETPSGPPPGGEGGHHHGGPDFKFLTADEKAELKKAHDAAATANPDLFKQDEEMHQKMRAAHEAGTPPDSSTMEEAKTLRDQVDAAMIKADPAVAPVIEKIKAHHPHGGPGGPGGPGGDKGGAGGPPPADSGT